MPLSHWARMRSHATVGRGERWPASVGMRRRAWLSIAAGPDPRLGDLDKPPGRQPPPSTGRRGRQTGPAAQCRLDEHLGRYEHGNPVSVGKRRISRVPTASSAPWGGVPAGSAGRGRRSSPRRGRTAPLSAGVQLCPWIQGALQSPQMWRRGQCRIVRGPWNSRSGRYGSRNMASGAARPNPGRTGSPERAESSLPHPGASRRWSQPVTRSLALCRLQCEKRELHAGNTGGTRAT